MSVKEKSLSDRIKTVERLVDELLTSVLTVEQDARNDQDDLRVRMGADRSCFRKRMDDLEERVGRIEMRITMAEPEKEAPSGA